MFRSAGKGLSILSVLSLSDSGGVVVVRTNHSKAILKKL